MKTFRDVRFFLVANGFTEISQLGDHAKFIKRTEAGVITAILPHYVDLAEPVIASILRQARLQDTVR